MTKDELRRYRDLEEEVLYYQKKLKSIQQNIKQVQRVDVVGSSREYPYTPKVYHINGVIITESTKSKLDRYSDMILKRKEESAVKLLELQTFINQIEDCCTRRIFTLLYIEGKSQIAVSRIMHMDQSSISRKVDNYLNRIKCIK